MRIVSSLLMAGALGAACALASCSDDVAVSPVPSADASAPDAPPSADAGSDAAGPLESAPPKPIPPDKRLDNASSAVVFDRLRGGVWTANGDVGSISYVDVDKGALVQEVAIGKDARSVALSPDFAWLAAVDRDGAQVVLLDAETRVVRRAIPLGTHPRAAIWDAANPRWLYVAVEDDGAVVIIDRTLGVIAKTVPVGRLPSGLAVSRQRRELYVTHRIDAQVSIVDLPSWSLVADVPLADEPANVDPTVPQGKPFAFESLAWASDGATAWLPHEILSPFHPFQFQRVLFPSVSVVDLGGRAEVQTDPNDPAGAIAGRKNLFAAINVLDPTGNTSVLSQPCAATLHPNGFVGYVVACGSEDLIVFDVTLGIAVDLVRGIPGDHPMGITLDDTGQRAWVISDQSKTLQMFDLANGDLTKHVSLVGKPIALVAKDTVDPEMRKGLTLFFRANAAKGDLATTGNNWMSCGGCHLDGLVTTNAFFFEALKAVDPTQDAQIGHVGMKDLFSTAPTPDDPSFSPHDVLLAMLDQGGLAPDRTGAKRDGEVDPNMPPPAATDMARAIAHVIARDLPLGPTWLLPQGKPTPGNDAEWCGNCHQEEYAAWKVSVHAQSGADSMVTHCVASEQKLRGTQYSRLCAGCHQPVQARLGDTAFTTKNGVTCLGCHDTGRLIHAGGNGDSEPHAYDWTTGAAHKDWATASLERLRKPEFCGTCHEQFVPGSGIVALDTLGEFEKSSFAQAGARCVDCHAPRDRMTGKADHRMPGGNVFLGMQIGDQGLVTAQKANLAAVIALRASRTGPSTITTVLKNNGAAHSFPTGVTDIREPWVEVQAVDASGKALARYGGPDPTTNLLPLDSARLGLDIAQSDGTLLFDHQLSASTRLPFDRRVLPGGSLVLDVTVPTPAGLPQGTDHLDAVLFYRNIRTQYYRLATGSANGAAPDVEVVRVKVQ